MTPTAGIRAFLQWPVNLMFGLAAASLVAWAVLRNYPIGKELDVEFVKALPQIGGVTVVSALLAYLVSEADRRRAELRSRQEPLQAVLNRVTRSYNNSKRARRNARALGLLPKAAAGQRIRVEAYDQCMADLNDAQLEFETIEDEILENPGSFLSADEIIAHLHVMEHYLGKIVSEYERERPKAQGQDDIQLASLGAFSEFIASAKVSDFKKNYSKPLRRIRSALSRDIVDFASGRTKPRKTEGAANSTEK